MAAHGSPHGLNRNMSRGVSDPEPLSCRATGTYEAAKLYFGCEDEEREVTEGTPHQLGRPGLGMPLAGGTFP